VESLFVQVTVVPALTVRVCGEKVKLTMLIELPETEEFVVVDAPFPDEHDVRDTTAIIAIIINITMDAFFK
jgi:hypothetical protein